MDRYIVGVDHAIGPAITTAVLVRRNADGKIEVLDTRQVESNEEFREWSGTMLAYRADEDDRGRARIVPRSALTKE